MTCRSALSAGVVLACIGALALGGCGSDSRSPSGSDGGGVDSGGGGGDGGTSGCPGALLDCGGTCVDTRYDPGNCGGCGMACTGGDVCNDGSCSSSCGVGTMRCGARCVDTLVDPANCGACSMACAADEVCRSGGCALDCVGGTSNCSGSCVDLASNRSNCGMCGNSCAVGEACFDGACGMRPTVDADGDTISDFDEQSSIPRDTDGDGTPDYMDLDSDGDGLTDAMEAGDAIVGTPPVDSDGDGTPDFQDLDSDNDGLSDATEVTLGTDPTLADTDGDGESDGIEVTGGSDPLDGTSCVSCMGGFAFDLPYMATPRTQELTFMPAIQKADVFFLIDTTGSMGGTITGLRTSLDTLITTIRTDIPDTAFGTGRHDDFPVGGYGTPGGGCNDVPFGLLQRITTNDTDARAGVAALGTHCGSDGPESQIEGIYQAATGLGFRSMAGVAWTPPFDPDAGFDATRGHGRIGGAGFRADALPIIILATDITFHRKWSDITVAAGDRLTWCGSTGTSGCDAYAATNFGAAADQQPKTVAETVTALRAIGAKVFGLAVDGGAATSDQRSEESAFAVSTGAYIDPDATGMCATGVSGALRPAEMWDPDGPGGPMVARNICPLVFSTTSGGTGVGDGISAAIRNLTRFVSFTTVHTEARDNPATVAVDETAFFVRGIPVSATPAAGCMLPTVTDRLPRPTGDGTFDTFQGVCPGTVVTFQIVMRNTTVMPTCTDQLFSMRVIVIGDDIVEADSRVVAIRVPGVRSLCP